MHSIKTQGQTEKIRDNRQQRMVSTLDSGLVWYRDHGLWEVVLGGDGVGGAGLDGDALELDALWMLL